MKCRVCKRRMTGTTKAWHSRKLRRGRRVPRGQLKQIRIPICPRCDGESLEMSQARMQLREAAQQAEHAIKHAQRLFTDYANAKANLANMRKAELVSRYGPDAAAFYDMLKSP